MIDYHTHTTFSDGANTVQELLAEAGRLGISQLAITDHFDPCDPNWKNAEQTPESLAAHFEEIRRLAAGGPVQVFCGIETSTGEGGALRLPPAVTGLCQLIITSVHYFDEAVPAQKGRYFNDLYWSTYKAKLLAQAAGGGQILGHPEAYLPLAPMLTEGTTFEDRLEICRTISERYFDRAFIRHLGGALLKSGKAYELHGASATPRRWVVEELHRMGVCFSIGSDAHGLDRLGRNARAMDFWAEMNLKVFTL